MAPQRNQYFGLWSYFFGFNLTWAAMIGFISFFAIRVLAAPPPNLTVAALKCYVGVLNDQNIFPMNRLYTNEVDLEKMVVSLCTYSDLNGARLCYHQAETDQNILPQSKMTTHQLGLEKKFARLCSNSVEQGKNLQTGDIDAIDCYKQVSKDGSLLKSLKEYSSTADMENHLTRLCISSNGRGARQCILESYSYPNDILKEASKYTSAAGVDSLIIDLCKGTRK